MLGVITPIQPYEQISGTCVSKMLYLYSILEIFQGFSQSHLVIILRVEEIYIRSGALRGPMFRVH